MADNSKTETDVTDKTAAAEQVKATPEMVAQLTKLREAIRQNYAQVVMAMSVLPRYRGQMISDLQHLVMDPLLNDRLAFAYKAQLDDSPAEPDLAGFAIWASVSEEVDTRIREQVKGGVFPVRLKPEDWNSGEINWLIDVVCPDPKMISSVVANFSKVANKDRGLRLHPIVARMMDPQTLEKMGAKKGDPAEAV